ncbi:MAG: metallophosphoesterase, partial [Variovorax sp.]|nr:metallophosphoesterase [Variovorax sp.]
MPIRPLSVLTALLHVYIALRLLPALASLTSAWPLALVLLVVSAVTMPLPFVARSHRADRKAKPAGETLHWVGLISMGWFSSLFILTLVRDLGLLLAWLASALGGLQVPDAVAPWSALAVLALATGVSLVGFFNAR